MEASSFMTALRAIVNRAMDEMKERGVETLECLQCTGASIAEGGVVVHFTSRQPGIPTRTHLVYVLASDMSEVLAKIKEG